MREASKTWDIWTDEEKGFLVGSGIDIGCGDCPIKADCRRFDVEDGDANCIEKYVQDKFDYVFSSHCLEHMDDPREAIKGWWNLVKPGGVMIVVVPDEDLYEQGVFPSQFNPYHKWTFTISKRTSWSPKSINVLDLVETLDEVKNFKVELQDAGYRRKRLRFGKVGFFGRCVRRFYFSIFRRLPRVGDSSAARAFFSHFFPVDQTLDGAMAQIQLRVRKK